MRRVSYHQSVFDLLDMQPTFSPAAAEMIGICEERLGCKLPEAVRQWYQIDRVVPLRGRLGEPHEEANHLWFDYSNQDHPEPLEAVLQQFAQDYGQRRPPWRMKGIRILVENQAVCSWFLSPDGSEDPPVLVDETLGHRPGKPDEPQILQWVKVADHFSDFVFSWIAGYYFRNWTPYSERATDRRRGTRPPRPKPYLNGLWLYCPDADPLPPPGLDFLLEHSDEDSRQEVAEGVMQYQLHGTQGRIRVTTDDYRQGGVSVWWLHADSETGLYHLARQVRGWCGLQQKLRPFSKASRPVLERLRSET